MKEREESKVAEKGMTQTWARTQATPLTTGSGICGAMTCNTGEVITPKVKGSRRVASELVNIRAIGTCTHLAGRIRIQR